jgi:hypothetical protein
VELVAAAKGMTRAKRDTSRTVHGWLLEVTTRRVQTGYQGHTGDAYQHVDLKVSHRSQARAVRSIAALRQILGLQSGRQKSLGGALGYEEVVAAVAADDDADEAGGDMRRLSPHQVEELLSASSALSHQAREQRRDMTRTLYGWKLEAAVRPLTAGNSHPHVDMLATSMESGARVRSLYLP